MEDLEILKERLENELIDLDINKPIESKSDGYWKGVRVGLETAIEISQDKIDGFNV